MYHLKMKWIKIELLKEGNRSCFLEQLAEKKSPIKISKQKKKNQEIDRMNQRNGRRTRSKDCYKRWRMGMG